MCAWDIGGTRIQAISGTAMYLGGILTLLLLALHGSDGKVQRVASVQCDDEDLIEDSIHNYTLPDLWGIQNISLSDYRGKVVLIVNVATY